MSLAFQQGGHHQGGDDSGVGLDDEHGGGIGQLVPGDLLVGRGTGVRTIRGGRIGNLAEVGPGFDWLLQVVLD